VIKNPSILYEKCRFVQNNGGYQDYTSYTVLTGIDED
jgi:hypothetical protein